MKKSFFLVFLFSTVQVSAQVSPRLQTFDFKLSNFRTPAQEFGPFARWWWPGNFVDQTELKREVNLFADNGLGGVEIQPLRLLVPGNRDTIAKANTWDTPGYYAHVIAVMQTARTRGQIVDMTDGGGWPGGGTHLNIEDTLITLEFASADITGGNRFSGPLPGISSDTDTPSL